jgi:hypothetical protein
MASFRQLPDVPKRYARPMPTSDLEINRAAYLLLTCRARSDIARSMMGHIKPLVGGFGRVVNHYGDRVKMQQF